MPSRPAPSEELNLGEVTEPRPAASLILLRDGGDGPEVLLVRRNPQQRFMGGAWVFPGGALHGDEDLLKAALRELEEEAGIALDDREAVVPFSRWITPEEVKVRFDTHFFVAAAPDGAEAKPDGAECVDARWMRPADALSAYERKELALVFPTIKHLEQLAELGSVAEALEAARGREVEPVLPRVVMRGGSPEVVLPGEAGYGDQRNTQGA
jgi:8-oxo-dGTP pyrophosphatase MutT (NUDIX family)